MLISRGRNPSAGEVITQLFSNAELRGRVLTTLGLLLIVRLGIYIPMPGIDREAFKSFIDQGGQLIGFLDIFTGGGISTLGVFALGIQKLLPAFQGIYSSYILIKARETPIKNVLGLLLYLLEKI